MCARSLKGMIESAGCWRKIAGLGLGFCWHENRLYLDVLAADRLSNLAALTAGEEVATKQDNDILYGSDGTSA